MRSMVRKAFALDLMCNTPSGCTSNHNVANAIEAAEARLTNAAAGVHSHWRKDQRGCGALSREACNIHSPGEHHAPTQTLHTAKLLCLRSMAACSHSVIEHTVETSSIVELC